MIAPSLMSLKSAKAVEDWNDFIDYKGFAELQTQIDILDKILKLIKNSS